MDKREDVMHLSREELYQLVWKKPVDILAREFGLSGRGLGKLCERYAIPVPPRGFWAKKAAGRRVVRPPLVTAGAERGPEIVLDLSLRQRPRDSASDPESPDPYRELFERLLAELGAIAVPKQLRKPHPMIARWLKQDDVERRRAREWVYGPRTFTPRYASPLARRRLRILTTLFVELERRGAQIGGSEDRYHDDLTVRLGRDEIRFSLSERIKHSRHRLTEAEKAARGWPGQEWTQTREPTGGLILKLSGTTPGTVPESWRDEAAHPLEDRTPECLAGILTGLAIMRERREAREAEERRQRQREAAARRQEQARQAELQKKRGLHQRVAAWQAAAGLRDYVAAVRRAAREGGLTCDAAALDTWAAWALAQAEEIDPLKAGGALETELLWPDDTVEDRGLQRWVPQASGAQPWYPGRPWWARS